jgi:hypothetical protein
LVANISELQPFYKSCEYKEHLLNTVTFSTNHANTKSTIEYSNFLTMCSFSHNYDWFNVILNSLRSSPHPLSWCPLRAASALTPHQHSLSQWLIAMSSHHSANISQSKSMNYSHIISHTLSTVLTWGTATFIQTFHDISLKHSNLKHIQRNDRWVDKQYWYLKF